MMQTPEDTRDDVHRERNRDSLSFTAHRLVDACQISAMDELHGDVVVGPHASKLVNLDDVWVTQARTDLRLFDEQADESRRARQIGRRCCPRWREEPSGESSR